MPTTVLFPGIVIPLFIEEPCDRDMIADALAGSKFVALAMVQPGRENDDNPPVCEVAGAGRIIHSEKLADGNYNVLIEGAYRVRLLEELPRDRTYRRFRSEIIPAPTEHDAKAARSELAKLESAVVSLVTSVAQKDAELIEVVRSTPDPLKLADILAATVVRDAVKQQELLATRNLRLRLSKLVDAMSDILVEVVEVSESARLN